VRAFVIRSPGDAVVEEIEPPVAGPGEVVVAVDRVGVCGTDVECFTGEMAYLHSGHARYPLRIGHEWSGRVVELGEGVEPAWLGRRTTGDTMLGCRRCRRCLGGRGHLCEGRAEIGLRNGWPGALAERLLVPASALRPLPDTVDDVAGALVEPGAGALRAVLTVGPQRGARVLVLGAGTIGVLAALFARSLGVEVVVRGRSLRSVDFARSLDLDAGPLSTGTERPPGPFDSVIDATNDPTAPRLALDLVEPGGRIALIGLAGAESAVDSRDLVLKDLTAIGVLSGSGSLDGAIEAYATGAVDPRPLVAATVGLGDVATVLAGARPTGALSGPKIHVDPRR
jgi:threonine dehydrogenase-like Zn-dependent dehydrogenase